MKTLVKTKVNPVEMKVGITTFEGLRNGRLLIETQNKKEIDALRKIQRSGWRGSRSFKATT